VEFLIVIEPASGGRYEHRVAPGSYVLGREEASCDIPILSPEVSRQHARIHLSADQCSVEDLGSTAGTLKDGQAFDGKQSFAFPVEISLGTTRLTVSVNEVVELSFDSAAQGAATVNPGSAVTFNQGSKENRPTASEVGHFTKGREIARGGMGAILEANDRMLGRTVAMKVVLGERASEDARMRFIREATVLGQLEHPNIIPIHELGKDDDGNLFYTMKMVEGRTLQAIINDLKKGDAATIEHYTLDRLLTVFSKVCDAIAFAHSKGIVHRDLKPENVMVGAFGEVLVMDWGLAKILNDAAQTADELGQQQKHLSNSNAPAAESALPSGFQELTESQMRGSSEELTMDGAVMGSPQYMPPEQAEGRIADIDEKSDIYSLGGILYAILTLRPPIKGKTVIQVLENVKSGNITPPTEYSPGGSEAKAASAKTVKDPGTVTALPHCPGGKVPPALLAVTMKAMAQKSAARYLSVPRLIGEIDAFQHGHATTAEDISPIGELLLLIKRNKAVALTGFVAVILLLGLGGYSFNKVVKERNLANAKEKEARDAEKAAKAAEAQQEIEAANARAAEKIASQNAYASDMLLMGQAWEKMNFSRMQTLLDRHRDKSDLHGFEWRYWNRLLRQIEPRTFDSDRREQRGGGENFRVGFHPDGRRLFSTGTSDFATQWDVNTGQSIEIRGPGRVVLCMTLSGDGRTLLLGSLEGVRLWDVEAGRELLKFKPHESALPRADMSPDGRYLVTRSRGESERLTIWLGSTGKALWELPAEDAADRFTFSPDGNLLAICYPGKHIDVWDIRQRKRINHFETTSRKLSVAFSPDGSLVALGGVKADILLWNLASNSFVKAINLPDGDVSLSRISFGPHGRLLAAGAFDNLVRVFEVPSGRLVKTFRGHERSIADVSFGPDGMQLASIGIDGLVKVWDLAVEESNELKLSGGIPNLKYSAVSLKGDRIAGGNYDGNIIVWEAETGLVVAQGKAPTRGSWGRGLAFSPDGSRLASWTGNEIYLWNLATGMEKPDLALTHHAFDVAFSHDGGKLALGGDKQVLKVWDIASNREVVSFKPKGQLKSVRFSADDSQLITASLKGSIELWDVSSGAKTREITGHQFAVNEAILNDEAGKLASAGVDGTVRIWNAETGEQLQLIEAHSGPAQSVSFTPSAKRLASRGNGDTIKIWDPETGSEMLSFLVLNGFGHHSTFDHQGDRLIIANGRNDVSVFDARPWTREVEIESRSRGALRLLVPLVDSLAELQERIRSSPHSAKTCKSRPWNGPSVFGTRALAEESSKELPISQPSNSTSTRSRLSPINGYRHTRAARRCESTGNLMRFPDRPATRCNRAG
jgi:eukaryotic-like serine/threonine-protein kinase